MKTAAVITVKNPRALGYAGRKRIAAWLRKQAKMLDTHKSEAWGLQYRGRYIIDGSV